MSAWLLVAAMVAAVNPFRSRLGLGVEPYPWAASLVGMVAGIAGIAALAAVSNGMLAALQITPETFLIAAGLVVIIAGARTMVFPRPSEEPALRGWRSGLWPLTFPRIVSPEVIALSLALPAQRGVGGTVAAATVGVVVLVGLAGVRSGERSARVLAAVGGIAGMVLVVTGIWMMIEGIRDV